MTGDLDEVFVGVQGEGLLVGTPMVFVRLAGCNLACDYCDTTDAREAPFSWRISSTGEFERDEDETRENPVAVDDLLEVIERLAGGAPRCSWVSITGGEPTLQAAFVEILADGLCGVARRVYLETNGSFPGEVGALAESIEMAAVDMKLASACGEDLIENACDCLRAAPIGSFAKLVLTRGTTSAELDAAAAALAAVEPTPSLVLQPATGVRAPRRSFVAAALRQVAHRLDDVRVIPQLHRIAPVF